MTYSLQYLKSLYAIDSVKGFGPQKFKFLHESGVMPDELIRNPDKLLIKGKTGDKLRDQLKLISSTTLEKCHARAEKQVVTAEKLGAKIITYEDPLYPLNVYKSNNPIPVLYAHGATNVLQERKVVAVVGSRGIRPPFSERQEDFTKTACKVGFTVVSGFALGADTIGHKTAIDNDGSTICVMPSGLDRPFPPENRNLWESYLSNPRAVFISEFAFGVGASALNLRKRNKLIVAFALGILVGQSTSKGGAMNAYRFGKEQKKEVATFHQDEKEDTSGNSQIEKDLRTGGVCFPSSFPSPEEYEIWLQRLSSSMWTEPSGTVFPGMRQFLPSYPGTKTPNL
jgi:DNA processing protein